MIVEYLGNVWRSLLSPSNYFAMSEDTKWRSYQEEFEDETKARDLDLMREGGIAWGSLTDSAVLKTRSPLFYLLTMSFMNVLNEVTAGPSAAVDLLVGSSGDIWDVYCESVEGIFEQQILRKVFEGEEERKVQGMFRRKWDFLKFRHEGEHFQRPMPLLTPRIVEGLGEVLSRIPAAHAEVSS